MPVKPIVRYMLICHDWQTDSLNERRINITGLVSSRIPNPGMYFSQARCLYDTILV
jgi:hypothetical protein